MTIMVFFTIQNVLDLCLFKLAFHTYEALSNKVKINVLREKNKAEIAVEDDDLVSVFSGETVATMSGPNGP